MKLDEIAEKIQTHLKRFESDSVINAVLEGLKVRPYYSPTAYRAGSYVKVVYVSYHSGTALSKADAEEYLKWLDAGNIGKHFTALSFNTRIKRGG